MAVNIGINIQRSPNRISQELRDAAVLGKFPKLFLDFKDEYYLANGGSKTFANAVTHARAGNATMTDGYGPELVTNGSFDSGIDNWTAINATLSHVKFAGRDNVISVADNGGFSQAAQTITTVAGKTYLFSVKVNNNNINDNGTLQVFDGAASAGNGDIVVYTDAEPPQSSAWQTFEIAFVATSSSTSITLGSNSANTAYFDNVSVREMPVIKWAPHNLCRNSEDATQSNFFKSNVTVTSASSVTAPNGTTGVSQYAFAGAASDNVYITDGGSDIRGGVTGTFAVFAKAVSSATTIRMRIWDNGTTGAQYVDKSVSADDWTLLTHEATTSSNSTTANFAIYNNSSGDASDIYVWGFHIFRSDLGGMVDNPDQPSSRASYVPTTSAAKYLPRIGHHVYNGSAWVNEGVLAESEARTNLFHYSHDFSNSYWAKSELTATANEGVAPDGTDTAFKLVESSTSSTSRHVTRGGGTLANSTEYTAAVYLKKGTRTKAKINVFTGAASHTGKYDIENGTVESSAGADAATIEDVGNGWFRCSITTTTASTGNPNIAFGMLPDDYSVTYDGDGSSYIYAWGATLEASPTRSSYIPTVGAATVTRAAETFTIPSANLPWPTPQYIGSELVTNGTFDTDTTGWTGALGATLSIVSGALRVTEDGSDGSTSRAYQAITTEVGKVYRVSVDYVGGTGGSGEVYINTSTNFGGAIVSDTTIVAGTTSTLSFVATATTTYILLGAGPASEYNDYDNVSVREINPLSVSIGMEGRVTYADDGATVSSNAASGTALPFRWRAGGLNYITHVLSTETTNVGTIWFMQEDGGTFDYVLATDEYSPDILVPFNVASRHGSTFINGAVDGVALTADTTPTALPDLSSTDLELAYDYMGTVSEFRVWDKDITDAGLVEATNPELEPSLSLEFSGSGTNSYVINDWSE